MDGLGSLAAEVDGHIPRTAVPRRIVPGAVHVRGNSPEPILGQKVMVYPAQAGSVEGPWGVTRTGFPLVLSTTGHALYDRGDSRNIRGPRCRFPDLCRGVIWMRPIYMSPTRRTGPYGRRGQSKVLAGK